MTDPNPDPTPSPPPLAVQADFDENSMVMKVDDKVLFECSIANENEYKGTFSENVWTLLDGVRSFNFSMNGSPGWTLEMSAQDAFRFTDPDGNVVCALNLDNDHLVVGDEYTEVFKDLDTLVEKATIWIPPPD